ncbi:MAG: SufS family cysteine desulfurase, partial [Imperialibacter sp.]|uniref:SufS family cysteine desulfurase n=1 Tax=Imperialibacter sp. TaxID=2038411 RepID=UPI0032EF7C77
MGSPASTIDWSLDIQSIRKQFPVLHQEVNGKPLIYFDNAATNQKPSSVIKALDHYYETDNANIHRGVHTLAERATADFEETRKKAAAFLNSKEIQEVIFTKGTTEGINLVASTWGRKFVNEGDEIVISTLEHHSNIVPWQMLCEEKGAILRVIPINPKGEVIIDDFKKLLSAKTKLVSVVFASNALGTVNPVAEIIGLAHQQGAVVMLDGAQASAHLEVDVQKLDVDFFALSAHKMYGPTGVGILYGKRSLLEAMPPYQGGGEMISEVTFEKTTYNAIPYKFEAGTPNIADVVAFGAAIDFINEHGKERIAAHEDELLHYATAKLESIPGVRIVGQATDKVSVVSFLVNGYHPLDVGMYLDARGIAVRTGHHCTQPLMKHLGIE